MTTDDDSIEERTAELEEEQGHFLALVADLDADGWALPTPAVGWTVHDQVAHVVLVEEYAATAVADPERFARIAAEAARDGEGFESRLETIGRTTPRAELLERWSLARDQVRVGLGLLGAGDRIAWFGPPMRPLSFLAARMMETWSHGQDVRDALGVAAPDVPRLRTIADLGIRTRSWSYVVRGREPDRTPYVVRLEGAEGRTWSWGEGPLGVSGTALDLCAVVTQRRHWARTELRAHLPAAEEWLGLAQAFAGPPTLTDPDRGSEYHLTRPGKPVVPRRDSTVTELRAEMTANVWKVLVAEGQQIAAGDEVMILESMKMEIPVIATADGTVQRIHAAEGSQVDENALLLVLE